MQPHEQRVIAERDELLGKTGKLNDFFVTDTFAGLAAADQILLQTQQDQMVCYLNTLNRRIERFLI